jgi:hypothetical protein
MKKTLTILVAVIILLAFGYYLRSSIGNNSLDLENYTFKDISFQHPAEWKVTMNPYAEQNGFEINMTNPATAGIQPDGLSIRSASDRTGSPSDYQMSNKKEFSLNDSGDSYIKFIENGKTIYAACAYYSKGRDTLDKCNQIIATVKVK